MTNKEAFALGFLGRLAERGVTPKQLEKRAFVGDLIRSTSPLVLAALVGVPAAAGILTGWGHASMSDVSEGDIERMKTQDRADTYRSEARRIRRKLHRSKWREDTPAEEF